MNPITTGGPELHLPAPITPNQIPQDGAGQTFPLPGLTPHSAEGAALPQVPIQPAIAPQPPTGSPSSAPTAQSDDVSSTTSLSVPAAADDQDLIEKEWVMKAKQIVENTRDNPYQQSQELTIFKNDYMQKRYNKTIKMAE
jgi:hypothetical protein